MIFYSKKFLSNFHHKGGPLKNLSFFSLEIPKFTHQSKALIFFHRRVSREPLLKINLQAKEDNKSIN